MMPSLLISVRFSMRVLVMIPSSEQLAMRAANTMRDALYNLHPDCGTNPEYARGIVNGIVSATMHQLMLIDAGLPFAKRPANRDYFKDACRFVEPYMPAKVIRQAFPESWLNEPNRGFAYLQDRMVDA